MTTLEFWDNYINKNILEIFDLTCDFFSQELPQEFIENYDVGEVILETRGHQEIAKNFDNVIKFTEILRSKHPEIYKEHFQYFDDFYVNYFCFQQDESKVREAFSNFIKKPVQDFSSYSVAFNKILLYKQTELLDRAISENFSIINKSDDLIGNTEYDLAMCQYYKILEANFLKGKEKFDTDVFAEKISKFNFEPGEGLYCSIKRGLFDPQLEAKRLKSLFSKDKDDFIYIIEGYFLKYMYQKGFPFHLSGWIWINILRLWLQNSKGEEFNATTLFNIEINVFEKYLSEISADMFKNKTPEMISVLWGSVYVYEFLYKFDFIDEDLFNDFIEISKVLKGKAIGQFITDLWNSNFVHCWAKPDCISETEFIEEEKIFRKSLTLKPDKFSALKNEISDELSNIGALSDFIIEGGKSSGKITNFDMFNELPDDEEIFNTGSNMSYDTVPVRAEKKVGRNEPCPCGSGKKYKKCCGKS